MNPLRLTFTERFLVFLALVVVGWIGLGVAPKFLAQIHPTTCATSIPECQKTHVVNSHEVRCSCCVGAQL